MRLLSGKMSVHHSCDYAMANSIEASMGFVKGDKFYVESGPLVGLESIIKGINRKKMEASFDLEFMGGIRRFTVGLELLRKI